jgi:tetratricopeptide (TPR) repeat protein
MTMGQSKTTVVSVLVLATLGLSGCAGVPKLWSFVTGRPHTARLEVRPAKMDVALTQLASPTDRLFARASSAIETRDYAEALDLLQVAKQQSPDDVRVLNAMAVVYDKLGRFDLSQRYYQFALATEPQSPVVLANIRYSARLQTMAQSVRPEMLLAGSVAPAQPSPAVTKAIELPRMQSAGGIRLAEAQYRPVRVTPLLAGGSLMVVNATGRASGGEPVRRLLASSGWTVRAEQEMRPIQARSQITFAEAHRPIAEALARTLPFQVAMVECASGCNGLELVLGQSAVTPAKGRG